MKVYGNNENIANDIFRSLRVPVTEENIITGQIDENVLTMASKIKTKNINNQHENSYYKNTNLEKFDPNNRSSFQNFHNVWVKENLYKKVSPAFNSKSNKLMGRLLDLGSGKGGDIGKWKRAKYEYVLGIEYDIKNIEYAKNLFSKIPQPKPKTYFVRGDLSKLIFPNYDAGLTESNKVNLNTFLPSQNTFNVVSIQFALHYFFKDEITLRTLLQNATDNLEVNGYFIGTCFDGKRVFNKLKGKKKIEGKTDGNLLWSIEKKYVAKALPNTKTTFGKEIDVFVKSIGNTHTEYLVNFDYLDNIMKEYGFNKIEVKSFSDYFDEMKNNGNNMKKIADEMTDVEKELSFLNNAFIYQKVENTPDSIRTNLIKLMKKQETKNYLNKNTEEIKETFNKLKVEEVKESTENLIEDDEENDMNTDIESDLEIQIDKKK
jgi:SAM-dependent methyltransferase